MAVGRRGAWRGSTLDHLLLVAWPILRMIGVVGSVKLDDVLLLVREWRREGLPGAEVAGAAAAAFPLSRAPCID